MPELSPVLTGMRHLLLQLFQQDAHAWTLVAEAILANPSVALAFGPAAALTPPPADTIGKYISAAILKYHEQLRQVLLPDGLPADPRPTMVILYNLRLALGKASL